ncbi:GCN5 family acetyltransferase [Lysobacter sp. Root983]|nr:GCN5 family acetyltransferase [Lysobacter sp. Root604]KRD77645.1 GCN5 family acetyltransferase [Lysobacter sp. Root983]
MIETQRLTLDELAPPDADFIVELLNDPAFLANIGDRGVRDHADALRYIANGPAASYAKHGFGLWLVRDKASGERLGLSGLLQRDTLPDADIGYAFLPQYRGQGYAVEACTAVIAHAREPLRLPRVLAIVSPGNEASTRVLEKIGLRYQRRMRLSEDAEELLLYSTEA